MLEYSSELLTKDNFVEHYDEDNFVEHYDVEHFSSRVK